MLGMTLRQQIEQDLTVAMKSRDALRTSVLRMVKTAIRTKEVEKTDTHLEDVQVVQLLQTLIKQRREAIEKFQQGNRPDLAEKEQQEILIIEGYMPRAVAREEILAVVQQVVTETGAASSRDFGRVMKAVMSRFAGQVVDGRLVGELVKAALP